MNHSDTLTEREKLRNKPEQFHIDFGYSRTTLAHGGANTHA